MSTIVFVLGDEVKTIKTHSTFCWKRRNFVYGEILRLVHTHIFQLNFCLAQALQASQLWTGASRLLRLGEHLDGLSPSVAVNAPSASFFFRLFSFVHEANFRRFLEIDFAER